METKKINYQSQGKKNRVKGKLFEVKVRADFESKGYIVCKWANNIDLEKGKIVPVKPKFNPFTKSIMYAGTGFPDYVCFKLNPCEILGVECKVGKYLDANEKAKCKWLIDKGLKILIASRGDKRGEIKYEDYNEI